MQRIFSLAGLVSFVLLLIYIAYDQSLIGAEAGEIALSPVNSLDSEQPFVAVSYDLPESISFAGEPVPLNLPDIRERLDKELQINV